MFFSRNNCLFFNKKFSLWCKKSTPVCLRCGFSSFFYWKRHFLSKKTILYPKRQICMPKDKFLRQKDNVSNPGFRYFFDISRNPGIHGLLDFLHQRDNFLSKKTIFYPKRQIFIQKDKFLSKKDPSPFPFGSTTSARSSNPLRSLVPAVGHNAMASHCTGCR